MAGEGQMGRPVVPMVQKRATELLSEEEGEGRVFR